ncbi:ATP-binding protein [Paenibacillus terrigena]|uniref:ATP-binding protein n=1 Tax=Paenibacillus terrigena TaxID=369333 RepID=UPI00036D82EA|nr:ATP-binding protein [Paenibacillus terrigena]
MEASYIVESKKRCLEQGMTPSAIPFSKNRLCEEELLRIRNNYREVISVMNFFGEKTRSQLDGIPILIALTDGQGYIIDFVGNEKIRSLVNKIGMEIGTLMGEEDFGTNAVHLALQEQKPIELLGCDHFHEHMHNTACYSVPFQVNQVDHLAGTVSMMIFVEHHNRFALPLLSNMVDSMEREIELRRTNHNKDIMNHTLIRSVNNGIIITDAEGYITECNQLIERIMNRKRTSMIGRWICDVEPFASYMCDVILYGNRFENQECTFLLSANKRITCILDAIPVVNDHQELTGAYLQLRDITERNELENQMLTYEKFSAIGKLAAGIAHEIRNPLTSIMGFIQLLREKPLSREMYVRYLEIVYGELLDLKRLVSDFVLMAKPSSPEKKEHILQDVVIETVQFMTSQANFNNIILTTDLYELPLPIYIDSVQIKQVLINLIQNAFEAMPKGGQVDIRLTCNKKQNTAVITIRDYGIGISKDQMKNVFNPFFTTKENGLGLGLSICYRIIENHNGKIQIKASEERGTKFSITLPLPK